jgi:LAO/AO transport system kinase
MPDLERLATAAGSGDPRAVARVISMIEDADPAVGDVLAALPTPAENPYVVGITGSPGVGKSTTTAALVGQWRAAGVRVAVLAVDPSSPFTGGALLGDRVRMQVHATDDDVYIRSMATRGQLGGVAAATPQAVRVVASAGFEVVLVETVGVGQAEVDIAGMADTTVVVLAPGMGDGIQAAKAGVLEVADILVVNKADRDGADDVVRDLRTMVSTAAARKLGEWRPVVARSVATVEGGVAELVEAIAKHREWLGYSGAGDRRRLARIEHEIRALAAGMLAQRYGLVPGAARLREVAAEVIAGRLDTFTAARTIVADDA